MFRWLRTTAGRTRADVERTHAMTQTTVLGTMTAAALDNGTGS